ncbi:diguanylate cyclase [Sulfurospirillum arcachonense]|uniref:diguanylate cyclase n=1 Tax=Sulfurospirillum arcachonense TaxID=57666 RepID=UPI00046A9F5F|nr:diguanylate cyclase [Sulfurospirillum arcachonense]
MTSEQTYFLTLALLNIVLALAGTRIKDLEGKPNSVYFLTGAFFAFSISWFIYVFEPSTFMKIVSAIFAVLFIWGIIVFSSKRCEKKVPWIFIISIFTIHSIIQSYFTFLDNFNAVLYLNGVLIPFAFLIASYLFFKVKKEKNSSDTVLVYIFLIMSIFLIARSIILKISPEIFSITSVSSQFLWPVFCVAIGVFSFLSFTEEAQDKLKIESITDSLTGVLNRRGFFSALKIKTKKAWNANEQLSLVLFDLDHFKNVNDAHGHKAGDIILKKCAQQIKEKLRESDLFGRFGGEEFAILLFGVDIKKAKNIVERMRISLEEMSSIYKEKNIKITASFGIVEMKESDNFDDVFIKADNALYAAKKSGRNKIKLGL